MPGHGRKNEQSASPNALKIIQSDRPGGKKIRVYYIKNNITRI